MALLAPSGGLASQQPWLRVESAVERDNQVRTAGRILGEYGQYLSPDVTLGIRLRADRTATDDGRAAPIEDITGDARLAATLSIPTARLGFRGSAGTLLGGLPEIEATGTVVYEGSAGLNLGFGSLRGNLARDRYTATIASLDTLVMTTSWEVALDRSEAPGWAAKVAAGRVDFGGDNPVSTAYGWVLGPLSRSAGHSLRVGYAASWQDAPESNWLAAGLSPPGQPPQTVPGRYAPYYTPHDAVTHSALVNAAVAFGPAWLLLDGNVGVRATETAAILIRTEPQPQAAPQLFFYERSYTPYRAGVSIVAPADDRTSVTVAGSYSRSAYYRTGSVRLTLSRSL
jgi:hypothetical protein